MEATRSMTIQDGNKVQVGPNGGRQKTTNAIDSKVDQDGEEEDEEEEEEGEGKRETERRTNKEAGEERSNARACHRSKEQEPQVMHGTREHA